MATLHWLLYFLEKVLELLCVVGAKNGVPVPYQYVGNLQYRTWCPKKKERTPIARHGFLKSLSAVLPGANAPGYLS